MCFAINIAKFTCMKTNHKTHYKIFVSVDLLLESTIPSNVADKSHQTEKQAFWYNTFTVL